MKKKLNLLFLFICFLTLVSCSNKKETELVVPETFYDELPNVIRFEDFANTTKRTTYIDEEGNAKEYNGFGLVAYFFYSPFCSICKKPEFEEAVKKASETVGFYVIDLYADREIMEEETGFKGAGLMSEFRTQSGPVLVIGKFFEIENTKYEKDGFTYDISYGYNTLEVLNKFTNYEWI